DGTQRRRLTRAVGAEERHHFTATHRKRKVAHNRRPVVSDAELVHFENRAGARHRVQNPPSPAFSRTCPSYLNVQALCRTNAILVSFTKRGGRTLASPPTCQVGMCAH